MKKLLFSIFILFSSLSYASAREDVRVYLQTLDSKEGHGGAATWTMKKAGDVKDGGEAVSMSGYSGDGWMPAVVPGTVLNSLVYNKIYPEPYFGVNNKFDKGLIPDIYNVGRDFYTYWFRTEFNLDKSKVGEKLWMQVDGVNYHAELWLNGKMLTTIDGMFNQRVLEIGQQVVYDKPNCLAVKVIPVDNPGTIMPKNGKTFGANGEYHNGGNGEVGRNVSMLMTVGWDFYYCDGIRDRNTGIWRSIRLFTTGKAMMDSPFVKSSLRHPDYDVADETISVDLNYPVHLRQDTTVNVTVKGEIEGTGISFEKSVPMYRYATKTVEFSYKDFPQLTIKDPKLWWPVNKGPQNLYRLTLKAYVDGKICDSLSTRFGIREIVSDTDTPDKSRMFRVNGKPLFIRGSNWIPEAMLRDSDERTYAQLRYTVQSGVNFLRMWGGGIAESDYFFDLCDEYGILVWQEFWMTGDTQHPVDRGLYDSNMISTIKRLRNHPSLAYYVSSNESSAMPDAEDLVARFDGTRGYQMQSECGGIHDGSPYKQVNPMAHYEDKASERGSRLSGFNPEYGAPCLPTVECLREMMDEKDLWPINKEVWDYSDGNGFHLMTKMYKDMVDQYGESASIDEYAAKAQFVGAMNYKTIWENWSRNKYGYGSRFASGFLFWYHNSAVRQVAGRMWDWSLEPTAALYYAQNACEPIHPQFDYLTNTISVNNEYYHEVNGLELAAMVYGLNSKVLKKLSVKVDVPADGVAEDVAKLDFDGISSPVQFIKLTLSDANGKLVGSSFYWRSNSKYEGYKTLTGPTTAGFEAINSLTVARVSSKFSVEYKDGKQKIALSLKNGSLISFFTQVQLLDSQGKPVRPSYYTDNFFSLVPGESKNVTIETDLRYLPAGEYSLVVNGFNLKPTVYKIEVK